MEDCIPVVEDAFKTYTRSNAIMPQRAVFPIEPHQGAFLVMPAYLGGKAAAFATKIVSVYPENVDKHHIPTVLATVCLFDIETGALLSVMDGAFITAMRTGAASGVATKYLARQDSTTLGIFGAGIQAKTQAMAICAVRDVNAIKVYDIDTLRCQQFSEALSTVLSIDVVACRRAQEAIEGSDIICTATTSTSPVFRGEWLSPGTHINGIGSYTPFTRELDTTTIKRAKVVVDSKTAALQEAGDILIPISEKMITERRASRPANTGNSHKAIAVKFEKLFELIEQLRGEQGCPWDREQTITSLKNDVLSEVHEVVKAIDNEDHENLKEEIGDLIWVTAMITQIAKERGHFDMDDVLKNVMRKMIRRHPHVFDDAKATTADETKRMFNTVKRREKME
jgi:ornithine cyclodeaminase/alanine dehydrogenase